MNNIKKIQEKLIEKNLDAVLVTDEKNQRYATGFPFTDGAVIVARSAAWLITDSRYIEAATNTAACCCNAAAATPPCLASLHCCRRCAISPAPAMTNRRWCCCKMATCKHCRPRCRR